MRAREPRLYACDACLPDDADDGDDGPAVVYVEIEKLTADGVQLEGLYICRACLVLAVSPIVLRCDRAVAVKVDDEPTAGNAVVRFLEPIEESDEKDDRAEAWAVCEECAAQLCRLRQRPAVAQ